VSDVIRHGNLTVRLYCIIRLISSGILYNRGTSQAGSLFVISTIQSSSSSSCTFSSQGLLATRDSEGSKVVVKEMTREVIKRVLVVEPSTENVLEMDEYSM